MPDFRMIDAGGAQIRAVVKGSGPLVLMVHGFPESWYSYRHQIDPIAEAGFTWAGAVLSEQAERSTEKRRLHRTVALSSIGISVTSATLMWFLNR